VSVAIPAFNEETNIGRLCERLTQTLTALELPWEIVLVDDGSSDGTWREIQRLHSQEPRIRGLRFSRNFGHQYALLAGLSNATGDAVICMDADLQHPPDVIPSLVDEWRHGSRIVNTIRLDSDDVPLFKRITSRLFYRIFSFLGGVRLEPGMADFRLFDRTALNTILSFSEQGIFLRGIVQWVGFPSSTVTFQSSQRFSGSTKYTLRRMIRFSLDGITSFSLVPLRLGILAGALASLVGFGLMIYALYAKLVLSATVAGWATTITVMSFMFGVLFVLVGLLGEYLGRVLIEVRGRPRFIVRDRIGSGLGSHGPRIPAEEMEPAADPRA